MNHLDPGAYLNHVLDKATLLVDLPYDEQAWSALLPWKFKSDHPGRECLPRKGKPLTAEHLGLPVEREVVAELAARHRGDQGVVGHRGWEQCPVRGMMNLLAHSRQVF